MAKNAIVITDLDGTFVYDSRALRPADEAAFHQLQKQFFVGIATGRSPKEVAFIETLGHFKADYKICFNGAIVEDGTGRRIVDRAIPAVELQAVLDYLKAQHLTFDALDGELRIGNYQPKDQSRLWGMTLICLDDPYVAVAEKRIYKINVRPGAERFATVLAEMQQLFPELGLFESDGKRIEVTAKNTSKGAAIQALKANFSGNVIGVGDSGNDVPMFATVDQAYCMAQAPADVQATADVVIDYFADLVRHVDTIAMKQEA
ncbi:HAD-IIB family hydrolase [Lacticaseibacillus porcinae]|uniref:HAD-IIB family hydrolase n=1 Tax=Lacticaseibacillus porcinae TaxID=1123687 RepID=UPI000F7A5F11|nr:HAD family hydrolase [Lacticaseibacillus porcinae]